MLEELLFKNQNQLPFDGEVFYFPLVFNPAEAERYFNELLTSILWERDQLVLFGKKITTKRKVAWYGDPALSYTYSHVTKCAKPWIPLLWELKNKVEEITHVTYNACLLNLYHNGEEGMSWHSDDEKELDENGKIASLSFGAERKFVFRHKQNKQKVSFLLQNGSVLLMDSTTQQHWQHALLKTKKIQFPRINLTFRKMK